MAALSDSSFGVIIPAAGKGLRMKSDTPKIFCSLDGQTVIEKTLAVFGELNIVSEIVIAAREEYAEQIRALAAAAGITVVNGGDTRQESVKKAFDALGPCEYVLIHDAVRPLVKKEHILKTAEAAAQYGGAVLGMPSKPTVKITDDSGIVTGTPVRSNVWEAQTPQIFRRDLFEKGLKTVMETGLSVTDDAQIAEHAGGKVKMVEGSYSNIKITTFEDLELAKVILRRDQQE